MSASSEKKLRLAAREAGTDRKTLAQEKQAKEQAKSKRRWTVGTVAVVVLVALVLLLNSSLVYRGTAFTVDDRKFSVGETSYYYANQYNYFANQYGSYASAFGLDTSNGILGLDKQDCPFSDGSWKDYFLDAAKNEMIQTTVLTRLAQEEGVSLDAEELAEIESSFDGVEEAARSYGYGSVNKMFAANYGGGVTQELVRRAYQESALASKVMEQKTESFTYTDEQLEEQYQSYAGEQDFFDYCYVYVAAETAESVDENGESVSAPTEESLAEAKKTAEEIRAAYAAAKGEDETVRLGEAAATAGLAVSEQSRVSGGSLYIAKEWLTDEARKAGDITQEDDENGSYVVLFLARDDNHYKTVSVRHILIKAEAGEDGSYSDEAKEAAKARAEEILAEFNAGEKSEQRFAELAGQYSEDEGSNTNGGLYEDIAKGRMVPEFDAFCFAGHQPGDTGIVYGESGSYAGYHVMYYVGEGELYSNTLAENDLRTSDLSAWLDGLTGACQTKESIGMKFVG